jgi:hypothetical protein
MSAKALQDRLTRRPFEPFRVVLSSGDMHEVRHPEMALLLKGGIYVALPNAKGGLPEDAVWCSSLHVAAIEPVGTQATGNSLGE